MYTTNEKKKNLKNIAGRKKFLLNPLLLSTVSELCSWPGSIPWGPCSVHRPRSRNCHLYTIYTSSNKPWSCAGRGTRMWDSPWSGWQQCPDSHLPVPQHQGRKAHTVFQHSKMQGDSVEGKGKSGGLCNTACSLCCSFSLKMLFEHRSEIIHLCHPLPFRAAAMFLGCSAKAEAAQHSEAARSEQLQSTQSSPCCQQVRPFRQCKSSGHWGQLSPLINRILILSPSLLQLVLPSSVQNSFPDFSHPRVNLALKLNRKHTNGMEKSFLLQLDENTSKKKTPVL